MGRYRFEIAVKDAVVVQVGKADDDLVELNGHDNNAKPM
jgi:hypothetical protein